MLVKTRETMEVDVKEFMRRQPGYPRMDDSARFYLAIAVRLGRLWDESGILTSYSDAQRHEVVLALTGYFQDIAADAGMWRAFTSLHRRQHGTPLPYYAEAEDYIDYELNRDDLRFLIHYTLADATLDPHDERLAQLATIFHELLDAYYEKAPSSMELTMMTGTDIDDVDSADSIYDYCYWLFWRSYLLRPSSMAAMDSHRPEAQAIIEQGTDANVDVQQALRDLNDRIMLSHHVGPIQLPVGEWMRLIAE